MPSRKELQDISAGLGPILPLLIRAIERRLDDEFPHPKPPETQLALMRLVGERDGITVREAAEALRMKPNNVSSLVSLLVAEGELIRLQDPADKRVAHLHITPRARARLAEVDALITTYTRDALATLSDAQITAIADAVPALTALAARLREP
ncbi:MarR family winged helix-turn-helix transcriptional regulator [Actinocorallia herbida]|uniref:MarR family winged helix-turn-helix transcriptional regulator n=1 Tax=Actinocorallia herbida TaxID=58109 RepID=UPI001FE66125|nr:MarR family transcriptional regulator [Actinocorallia herbida]